LSIIIRAPRPTGNFTMVSNDVARDDRISYRAFGLLVHILSHQDGWRIDASELARGDSREGRTAVLKAMKELENAGYVQRTRNQDERGRWTSETVVYDTPHTEREAPQRRKKSAPPNKKTTKSPRSNHDANSEVPPILEAWKEAAHGKSAQSADEVSRVISNCLNNGITSDVATKAVVSLTRDGYPITGWRLTEYINGNDRKQPSSIHYAADRKVHPSEYSEDL